MGLGVALAVAAVSCGDAGTPPAGDDDAVDAAAPGPIADAADVLAPDSALPGINDAAPGTPDAPLSGDFVLPPVRACTPAAAACDPAPAVDGVFASYRKDAYLDEAAYPEYTDAPLSGGRVQVAAIAAASGEVTRVVIDGVDADSIYTENPGTAPAFEWYHVWPRTVVAGEPVWVAFHARDAAWDGVATATIAVETTGGDAVRGSFSVARTDAPITYVTTTADRMELVVHVANRGAAPVTLSRLVVDGRDVTAAACIPDDTLAPGTAAMWTVPLCAPAEPGRAWTVVADYVDGVDAVGVGRVLPPRFPIEAWQNTSECPFPSARADNYDAMRAAGFDTMYFHGGMCQPDKCGCDKRTLLEEELPALDEWYALANANDILNMATPLADTRGLVGLMTGDESDGQIYDDETGVPNAARKAAMSVAAWLRHPELPTFNGGKTNGHVGTFAGMADVQGMDLYVAACAPHITPFGNHPPLRGAYDYLRNTRDNHMPGPTWLYSQGLAPTWNQTTLLGVEVHVQPDPQEIAVQAMSVVAAGGKGLLWFQSNQDEAAHAPARWDAIARANRIVRAVREHLRVGDVTGMVATDAGSLAESIRARRAIVVPIINLTADATVDDIACGAGFLAGDFPHWTLASHDASVRVTVPDDFGVADVFEVTAAAVVDAPAFAIDGRDLAFGAVRLDNETPARLLVIAGDADLRDEISADL